MQGQLIAKKKVIPDRAPLVTIKSTYPLQMVSLDYMLLDRAKGGYEYALVCIDHFTRYVQVYATKNNKGLTAADKLFDDFVLRFGFPERIHHDQGKEFDNHLFDRLHQLTGIKKSRTTPYHPQGDGQTERANRTIISMLRTLSENEKLNWPKHLKKLSFAFNTTVSKSTGFSPHYLMFGRSARLPIDRIFGIEPNEGEVKMQKSYVKYVEDWTESMNQAFQIAQKHAAESGNQNKRYYDKKVRGVDIVVGDRVLHKNRDKEGRGKLRTFWEDMVYVVVDRDENTPVYSIKPESGRGKLKRVHRNDIMQCNDLLSKEPMVSPQKISKPKNTTTAVQDGPERVLVEVQNEEESDTDELLGIVRDEGAEVHEDAHENDGDEMVIVPEEIEEENEDTEEAEPVQEDVSEVEDDLEDPASSDEGDSSSSSPSPSVPTRTSSRVRTQTKRLTYHVAGGDPSYS